MNTADEIAVDSTSCPRCGVAPGEMCRTKNGHRATWTHAGRSFATRQAWGEGYQEGEYYLARWVLNANLEANEFARMIRACERIVKDWEVRP